MHSSEITLDYLERIENVTPESTAYVRKRAKEVQGWIDRLQEFGNRRTNSDVTTACRLKAEDMQRRVD